jgi:MFS family permease
VKKIRHQESDGGKGWLTPLRSQPFRRIFLAGLGSTFGDWGTLVAVIAIITFHWHRGPTALAEYTIAAALPYVAFAPIAGVIADKFSVRKTMVACDLIRCVIVLCLAEVNSLPLLLCLIIARGTLSTTFDATKQKAIKTSVPREVLLSANSLSTLSTQITRIAGPAIAGIVIAAAGYKPVFYLDAASYCISAAFLVGIKFQSESGLDTSTVRNDESHRQFTPWRGRFVRTLKDASAGLSFLVSKSTLLVAVGVQAIVVFMVALFDTLAPIAIRDLGFTTVDFGVSLACVGIGIGIASYLVGEFGSRLHPFTLISLGAGIVGICFSLFGALVISGTSAGFAPLVPLFIGMGFGAAAVIIPYSYIIQAGSPTHLLGRVAAAGTAIPTTMQLIAPAIGAAVAVALGVGVVLVVSGLGLTLLGVVLFARRDPLNLALSERPVDSLPNDECTG